MDALLEMGMNTFGLQFNEHIVQHLKELGLLDMAVLYTHDEPGERRDLAWRREHYEDPHKMDPGVSVMATVHPYEFAEGAIDVWVPVSNNLNPAMARRMQARNDEVWWYVCCGPKWPFANYFIDYQPIDLKLLEQMVEQIAVESSDPERLRATRQLLTLDGLTTGPRTYCRDPRRYLDHHRQVIGLAETMGSEE